MDSLKFLNIDMVQEDEPLRSECILNTTGEEQRTSFSRTVHYDTTKLKPKGDLVADEDRIERRVPSLSKVHKIGTWNVRSMSPGKLDIVKSEMIRTGIEILGVSELRWKGLGHFRSDDFVVYYSGNNENKRNGVALILTKNIAESVMGYRPVSERIISMRIQAIPVNLTVIQIYSPTTDAEEEEIENFYGELQQVIEDTPGEDTLMIIGDFNAKVGVGEEKGIVGMHGLGDRNYAGDRLIEFCGENDLCITNTFFEQHKRRLYTWTSPNGQNRNQIDYILCRRRWKSSIRAVKTLPGADCGTDHELLVATFKIKLKSVGKRHAPIRFDLEKIPESYRIKVENKFAVLNLEDREPDELWEDVKNIVRETANEEVPRVQKKKRARWISDHAIMIANDRREAKRKKDFGRLKGLNADFQRQVRRDKENYLNDECKLIEDNNRKGKTRDLFKKIREITGTFRSAVGVLRDKKEKDLMEEEDIRRRWRDYTESLYKKEDDIGGVFKNMSFDVEPNVMEVEVRAALNELGSGKAPGVDEIPIELLRNVGDETIKVLTAVCNEVWTRVEWPREWKRSIFLPIPKKGDIKECKNYRTIALIPHASKVLLKIIQRRIEPFVEREMPSVQAGFRKGRGTRDQIANLRWIMEKSREFQKEIYICFIDYSKAFDCVDHDMLWYILRKMGIPEHLLVLIKNLYTEQMATVKTVYGETESFRVERGVRQGCILSPYLFNLYTEYIMRMVEIEDVDIGIRIGGLKINNLRYADDTTLLAENKEDLKWLIKRIKVESEKFGLKLNIKKTKVMTTGRMDEFRVDDELIEVVESYLFLGTRVNRDGNCMEEIKHRLMLGRRAMTSLVKIMKDQDVSIQTKIRIVKAIVFPVVMYGCESWTLRKSERKKIDSFELWCWRRLLRISWMEKRTNKYVLDIITPESSLEAMILELKLRYFGHVLRMESSLEKKIMLGRVEGRRGRGRPRIRWMEEILNCTNMSLVDLKIAVGDRVEWRSFVHGITKSRNRLDGT